MAITHKNSLDDVSNGTNEHTPSSATHETLGRTLRQCLGVTFLLLVLCCGVYPGLVTAAAQVVFPRQANGSLVVVNGVARGSDVLGQTFADPSAWPEYFWGRPSGASVDSATSVTYSSGSNYGPSQPALKVEVAQRVQALRDTGVTGPIPIDLVTKSGSGLDPHISPAAADIQVPRIAKARAMTESDVRAVVASATEGSTFGFVGEPRVNVLQLNLALDVKKPVQHVAPAPSASAP